MIEVIIIITVVVAVICFLVFIDDMGKKKRGKGKGSCQRCKENTVEGTWYHTTYVCQDCYHKVQSENIQERNKKASIDYDEKDNYHSQIVEGKYSKLDRYTSSNGYVLRNVDSVVKTVLEKLSPKLNVYISEYLKENKIVVVTDYSYPYFGRIKGNWLTGKTDRVGIYIYDGPSKGIHIGIKHLDSLPHEIGHLLEDLLWEHSNAFNLLYTRYNYIKNVYGDWKFLSEYAATSYYEYVAECIQSYLTDKDRLKTYDEVSLRYLFEHLFVNDRT